MRWGRTISGNMSLTLLMATFVVLSTLVLPAVAAIQGDPIPGSTETPTPQPTETPAQSPTVTATLPSVPTSTATSPVVTDTPSSTSTSTSPVSTSTSIVTSTSTTDVTTTATTTATSTSTEATSTATIATGDPTETPTFSTTSTSDEVLPTEAQEPTAVSTATTTPTGAAQAATPTATTSLDVEGAGSIEVNLEYLGQPPSTAGATCGFNHFLTPMDGSGERFLGNLCDSQLSTNIPAGDYMLRLSYQFSDHGPLLPAIPVTIATDQTAIRTFEVSSAVGIVTGTVTVDGQPPTSGQYGVCASTNGQSCQGLGSDGRFALMLPAAVGSGYIYLGHPSTQLGSFSFEVLPGETTTVDPAQPPPLTTATTTATIDPSATATATAATPTGTLIVPLPEWVIQAFPAGFPDGTEVCFENDAYSACQPVPFGPIQDPDFYTFSFELVPPGTYDIYLMGEEQFAEYLGSSTIIAGLTTTLGTATSTPSGTATATPEDLVSQLLAILVTHLSAPRPPDTAVLCVNEPGLAFFDSNDDGGLSLAELQEVANAFPNDAVLRDLVSQAETDGLASLDYQDCSPTATATPTVDPMPSPTTGPLATSTSMASPTVDPSATATITQTIEPSATATSTATQSPTATPTIVLPDESTPTTTPSPSATITPTPDDPTGTAAATTQSTPTQESTPSSTATETSTVGPTETSEPTATTVPTADATATSTAEASTGTLVTEIEPTAYFDDGVPEGTEVCISNDTFEACQPLGSESASLSGVRAFAQRSTLTVTFENVPPGTYEITIRVPDGRPIIVGNATVVADPIPTATSTATDTAPTATSTATATATSTTTATSTATATPIADSTNIRVIISSSDPAVANVLPRGSTLEVSQDGTTVYEMKFQRRSGAPMTLPSRPISLDRGGVPFDFEFGDYTLTLDAGDDFDVFTDEITMDASPIQVIIIELQADDDTNDPVDTIVARLIAIVREILERFRLN